SGDRRHRGQVEGRPDRRGDSRPLADRGAAPRQRHPAAPPHREAADTGRPGFRLISTLPVRSLDQWARSKVWPIPLAGVLGIAAVAASLLLYKAAFVDKGPLALVVADLALFYGGGFLATWATVSWHNERQKFYERRRAQGRKRGS